MNVKILSLLILLWFVQSRIFAQDNAYKNSGNPKQNCLIISSLTGTILFSGSVFYFTYFKNNEHARFHFYNDNNGFLQIDKLAHSYYSYTLSSIWYRGLTNAGINKERALLLGGVLGSIPLTTKELFDGFSKNGGFSLGDILANTLGSVFFASQELLFNEQILKYKSSFSRSDYADQANGYLGKTVLQSYFKDFNGHTYWFSINASKIFPKTKLPDWISIAAGYSANGMFGKYENIYSYNGVEIPETQRYRQFLLSLDVDWSEINVKSKFLRIMLNGLNFIKVPFPAIEINSKGQFKGYWIYF
jgi:hypothetical protein